MNREKYPNYFLVATALYIVMFISWFSYFFVPLLGRAFLPGDFYILSIVMILPLPLFAVYHNSARFQFIWGKEHIIREIISIIVVLGTLFAVYMSFLLF